MPVRRAWRNSRSSVDADSAAVDGRLPRRPHLAEDLALAEDERVESGGDLEEVGRRGVVVEGEEVGMQLVERHAGEGGEELGDVGVRPVEALGDEVHLGAPTRRQHGDLADRVALGERGDRLGDVVGSDGQPFEHGERRGAMVHTDDDDRHVRPAYPPWASWPRGVRRLRRRPGAARSS